MDPEVLRVAVRRSCQARAADCCNTNPCTGWNGNKDINKDVAVGDLTSNAPGSGARKNGNKVDYSLLPLQLISDHLKCAPTFNQDAEECFRGLFRWQRTGDASYIVVAMRHSLNEAPGLLLAFDDCARVLEYGKKKYAAWNWAKGMPWSVPFACAIRHLIKINQGQEIDEESGCSHWGHVTANILMLLLFTERYPELNDMPFKVLQAPCGI